MFNEKKITELCPASHSVSSKTKIYTPDVVVIFDKKEKHMKYDFGSYSNSNHYNT